MSGINPYHGRRILMVTRKRTVSTAQAVAATETAFVSIGGLSRATGVPIETLRTWELRYGFPKSVRKPSGHRLFEVTHVERIRRIANALERGLRAGEVVPATDAVLEALLSTVPKKPVTRSQALPFDARSFIEQVRRFDADRLMRSLYSELSHEDPLAYLETRITPCLEVLGKSWAAGEIDISHEHFASERISDVLRGARLRFEETATGPLVVLATLPSEEHGLGIQMAALILVARGLRVLSLGTEVPTAEVAALAERLGASAVGLSVSISSHRSAPAGVAALRAALAKKIDLVVGGAGAPKDLKGTTIFANLSALDAWARQRAQTRRKT
ncbi:MAG: MerR family transcriptional regulator [Vicinamibacteria bacterium]